MKKNPLEEIYSSKVLLNEEASKSNVVVPAGQLKIAKNDKVNLAPGHGTEKAKKDLEDTEEVEGAAACKPTYKESMEAPKKSFEGSFEKLFKSTINEEDETEMNGLNDEEDDLESDVPVTNDEMVDELEGETDEVSDLVSDLKAVMDHLQTILDRISGEQEAEAGTEEEMEMEFGNEEPEEFEDEESTETEEEAVGESVELKHVPDSAGKKLQGKNNKVALKAKGGKANPGKATCDPKLKAAKSFNKNVQSTKGRPEVGNVKKGEFFK